MLITWMQGHNPMHACLHAVLIIFSHMRQCFIPGPHLHADEEARGAVHIGHGRDGQHVPEGLPVLAVVEDAHGRLGLRFDGVPDDGDRLRVRVWALCDTTLASVHAVSQQVSKSYMCCQ